MHQELFKRRYEGKFLDKRLKASAHKILDRVRDGKGVAQYRIDWALKRLGDLDRTGVTA